MCTQKPLRLSDRLKLTHPSLSYSSCCERLLDSVVLIPLGAVDRLRNQFSVSDSIAAQLICDDLPGLTAMTSQ